MLLIFATGDHLLVFYRHHLVRDLMLDRSRNYQGGRSPAAETATATGCSASCKPIPGPRAAPRAGPRLPPPACPGAPPRLPSQGRPPAVVLRSRQRPLSREERRPTLSAAPPNHQPTVTDVLTEPVTDVLSEDTIHRGCEVRAKGAMSLSPGRERARQTIIWRAVGGMGRGSLVDPERYASTPAAQARPSAMAQTINDWPRPASPQAKTPSTSVA